MDSSERDKEYKNILTEMMADKTHVSDEPWVLPPEQMCCSMSCCC